MLNLIRKAIAKRAMDKAATDYEMYQIWNPNAGPWQAVVAAAYLRRMQRAAARYANLIND